MVAFPHCFPPAPAQSPLATVRHRSQSKQVTFRHIWVSLIVLVGLFVDLLVFLPRVSYPHGIFRVAYSRLSSLLIVVQPLPGSAFPPLPCLSSSVISLPCVSPCGSSADVRCHHLNRRFVLHVDTAASYASLGRQYSSTSSPASDVHMELSSLASLLISMCCRASLSHSQGDTACR